MTEQSAVEQEKKNRGTVSISTQWETAEDLPTIFANHLFVTHAGGNEFYLVFGELNPQPDLDRENPPEYISIKPVAKIAVSPDNMANFARVIQDNVKKYLRKAAKQETEGGDQ